MIIHARLFLESLGHVLWECVSLAVQWGRVAGMDGKGGLRALTVLKREIPRYLSPGFLAPCSIKRECSIHR